MNSKEESQITNLPSLTYLNFRNPAKKMKPRRGHLRFDLVAARPNKTLGEKIESAHDCKTDKNS